MKFGTGSAVVVVALPAFCVCFALSWPLVRPPAPSPVFCLPASSPLFCPPSGAPPAPSPLFCPPS
eukprot:11921045-Alexandrium_andersonii.AAC.1